MFLKKSWQDYTSTVTSKVICKFQKVPEQNIIGKLKIALNSFHIRKNLFLILWDKSQLVIINQFLHFNIKIKLKNALKIIRFLREPHRIKREGTKADPVE